MTVADRGREQRNVFVKEIEINGICHWLVLHVSCDQECGRQLSDRADELCYPLLGVLLCLPCHYRRLGDSAMTSTVSA